MGRRMAARLIAAGHDVTLWSRTPLTEPLAGAAMADSPRAAAVGAEVVLSMVRDDAASTRVWLDDQTGALGGMAPGAVGIEMSTISPTKARLVHAAAADRGIAFLDAPVAGSRPQAEAGQLIFLAGGNAETLGRVEPVLLAMGAAVQHVGGPGTGAGVNMMVNALLAVQQAALAELLGLAGTLGVDPGRAVEIIGATPVASPALKAAAGAMLEGRHAPVFPIDLVIKDLSLALAAGADLPVTRAVTAVYSDAAREGLDSENITAVALRYLRR
jgi:3-hydroxyisobutyrate dehydrogenase